MRRRLAIEASCWICGKSTKVAETRSTTYRGVNTRWRRRICQDGHKTLTVEVIEVDARFLENVLEREK